MKKKFAKRIFAFGSTALLALSSITCQAATADSSEITPQKLL